MDNQPSTDQHDTPLNEQPSQPHSPEREKWGKVSLVVFSAAFAAALLPIIAAVILLLPLPIEENKTVIVPRGAPVQAIAAAFRDNGIPLNTYMFRFAARLLANDNLKAGEYRFTPGQNLTEAVLMMRYGQSVVRLRTVPEGLTSHEVAAILLNDIALAGDIPANPPEGTLLPETYRYSYGDSRKELLERMRRSQRDLLKDLWEKRDTGLPLKSPGEAVILASIIEKETGKKAERARIAGVFYNRLRLGMPLQSDPTVIYTLTKGRETLARVLTKNDLALASPYNSYLNTGLPPGPISNPGRASIEAALHPEKNDFLYFVADGTGGHAFSGDIATHNKNVSKWQSLPKK